MKINLFCCPFFIKQIIPPLKIQQHEMDERMYVSRIKLPSHDYLITVVADMYNETRKQMG